jgi:hypothetical protein
MPSIEITSDQFQRLQKFAEPLVDTPQSAFEKILAIAERGGNVVQRPARDFRGVDTPKETYDRSSLPSVKHTYIRSARIDGKPVARTEWNASLLAMLSAVASRTPLLPALRETPINATAENRDGVDGYAWREQLGLSVQGVSAETASRAILQLGDAYSIPVEIEFGWHNSPKASKPGKQGLLIAGSHR